MFIHLFVLTDYFNEHEQQAIQTLLVNDTALQQVYKVEKINNLILF